MENPPQAIRTLCSEVPGVASIMVGRRSRGQLNPQHLSHYLELTDWHAGLNGVRGDVTVATVVRPTFPVSRLRGSLRNSTFAVSAYCVHLIRI